MTRRLSRARVQQAAEIARALGLKALEVGAEANVRAIGAAISKRVSKTRV